MKAKSKQCQLFEEHINIVPLKEDDANLMLHALNCPECTALFRESLITQILINQSLHDVPPNLDARILQSIPMENNKKKAILLTSPVPAYYFVVACVLFIFISFIGYQQMRKPSLQQDVVVNALIAGNDEQRQYEKALIAPTMVNITAIYSNTNYQSIKNNRK